MKTFMTKDITISYRRVRKGYKIDLSRYGEVTSERYDRKIDSDIRWRELRETYKM